MQALSCRSAAARRCVLQQAAKRPLGVGGSHHPSPATLPILASSQLHASAPALGGGTPGEWNHVHQWKTRAKLAAMKEAALAAEGKGKGKQQEEQATKAKQDGGIAALPGEKVLVLDENLPDGALEEYFAGLRSSKGGDSGAGAEATAGKPKRRTIKKHMLFGWNYKRSDKGASAAAGGGAGAAKPSQPKKATAVASSE